MANAQRGEVAFECDGKSYALRFSSNALCELEDILNCGVNAIATQLSNPENLRIKTVRAVFWAGLLDRNPEMTLRDAGEIITSLTLPVALTKIGLAFSAAFPSTDESATVRPLMPEPVNPGPAGTGATSFENGAKPGSKTKSFGAAPHETSSVSLPPAKLS
jgi:hypothetical protein